jgi:hypothetical protein
MKTFLLILFAALFLAVAAHAEPEDVRKGVWTADFSNGHLNITVFRGAHDGSRNTSMLGFNVAPADVGLAQSDVEAPAANVTFALKREAGTVAFEGRFATGDGAGQYRFTPNESFARALRELGYEEIGDRQLLLFAVQDLRIAVVRDLIAMGRKPTRRELDEVAIFGITPQLLREFASLGYPDLTIREAVQMKIGRVDARFVNELAALGYKNLSAREISNLGILGVTPVYIRSLRDAGLRELSARDATNLRIGQITPERIAEFRRAGYDHLTPRELSDFGIHRVTPEFIQELRKLGYTDLTPRQLIDMKIHSVTPEYIRSMTKSK